MVFARYDQESFCAPAPSETVTLPLVEQLVQALGAAGVRYCHWKSNVHLKEALAGGGDLDLLIASEDAHRADAIFSELGFKHFVAIATKRYNGITDFVGFDEASGRIVHLHTHYCLTLGRHRLKDYRLPWEDDLLNSVAPASGETPIPIPSPEAEMLLLLVRTCLKVRLRDRLLPGFHERNLMRDFETDRAWLHGRIDLAKLETLSGKWLRPALWERVKAVAGSPCDRSAILHLRKEICACLSGFRVHGVGSAFLRAKLREAAWIFGVLNKRYLHWPHPWGRTATHGGRIICILGASGAGKSTLTREIVRWLNFKLDAMPIYMGSGHGPSSMPRRLLVLLKKRAVKKDSHKSLNKTAGSREAASWKRRDSFVIRAGLLLWGVTLAIEKRNKLRLAWRASNRGMIVVTDRYPQSQFLGFNDGPLLQGYRDSPWRFLRAISKWELGIYQIAERISPDLVIKLDVPIEVASARRPDMDHGEIARRVEAVARMSFPERTKLAVIAADLPYSEVLARAKMAIWSLL